VDAYGRITAAANGSGSLPAGTENQVLQHTGAAWAGSDNLTLPAGDDRTITIPASQDTGHNLILLAPSGVAEDDDGSVLIHDASANVGVKVGGASHGATQADVFVGGNIGIYAGSISEANRVTIKVEYNAARKLGFFGTTPVVRQDVGYYSDEASNAGHAGTTLLALIDVLVATGLITKHVVEA
jgi:hypothetical protein